MVQIYRTFVPEVYLHPLCRRIRVNRLGRTGIIIEFGELHRLIQSGEVHPNIVSENGAIHYQEIPEKVIPLEKGENEDG